MTDRGVKEGLPYYTLKDTTGEVVQGTFYQSELNRVKVTEKMVYMIGKVLRRRRNVFSQVDCSLQQTSVTQTGTNYPYKAYIDTLLESGANDRVLRDSQLFQKNTPGRHDDANTGLFIRSLYTDKGRLLELEGPLHLDVFRQKRLIVNGVSLTLKLWPSKNAFRLMSSEEGAAYAVQILDASFKLSSETQRRSVDGPQ